MNSTTPSIASRLKDKLGAICARSGILLVGLTGGIASGKSIVAAMLEEMGAQIIDFDILARKVVEPGRPAWKEIVDCFGREILLDDDNLDRKMLSGIVFSDTEKRKRLEAFIHPRISEEFIKQVDRIALKDPASIILGVVPLLFEGKMQDLYQQVVVVYISGKKQIERLTERDGISRKEATRILDAQMPIDEKVGYADLVINNEGPLQETREQVRRLWQALKELQK